MGRALMQGVARSGAQGYGIGFTDRDPAKAAEAAQALKGTVYASNTEAVEAGDMVFLAVKPQVLPEVLAEIAPALQGRISAGAGPLVISMAAGWSLANIQATLGGGIRLVRIMPNTPALIGQGLIALSPSPEVSPKQLQELQQLLAGSGLVDQIDEAYLDAVTALSGSGPGFVYLFIEALVDGAVRTGLPRDRALRYAAQTLQGAVGLLQETGKHPGALKDMVTSPGGTTIAGIAVLETGAFRGTVMNAVDAAWRRSQELSAP
jgi:pyrroline-5-carboxylate reductase